MAVLVLGLGVMTAACGKYSISNIRSLKAFQDANNFYKKNEYKAAIERYEDAIRLNPDLGFAYFFLGNSYDNLYKPARRGEPENDSYLPKAVEYYEMAIQKLEGTEDPKEQEIRQLSYQYLITAYGPDKLDDFDKAVPVARQLISMQPDEPAYYQALAGMYEARGQFEDAERLFHEAIDARPTDPIGYTILAGYYNRQGEFEKTIEAFQKRADLEPNNPEAWHVIGNYYQDKAYRDEGLPRAVRRDYTMKGIEAENRALALNDTYADAMIIKNILLRLQAQFETSPARQRELIREADELRERGLQLREQQTAAVAGSGGSGAGS
jgi:tetratricopeptide (TPR) repeat protein